MQPKKQANRDIRHSKTDNSKKFQRMSHTVTPENAIQFSPLSFPLPFCRLHSLHRKTAHLARRFSLSRAFCFSPRALRTSLNPAKCMFRIRGCHSKGTLLCRSCCPRRTKFQTHVSSLRSIPLRIWRNQARFQFHFRAVYRIIECRLIGQRVTCLSSTHSPL